MKAISSYKIDDEIYRGLYSIVYAGRVASDNNPVFLKTLREECLTTEGIYNLKKEFEIIKKFENRPGVIQSFGIEPINSSLAIVVEDFGAKSLSHWLENTSFSLDRILEIGISIASALAEIHANYFMHKDINPNNIVYNADTKELKIIDFGIASWTSRENPGVEISGIDGTLAYISPEQTGRMNRLVDYRTDLYSFGATLYDLMCGKPPFLADDLMEIVHCHIAREPPRVDEVNPEIPAAVADIVAKLLLKNAEDRYQSAHGVKADLEHCFRQIGSGKRIVSFPLGRHDFSDCLMTGQKLYGRSQEIDRLLSGFEQVLEGKKSLFLISGVSGVGKTALVNEVHKPMTERQGLFISSKFDQFDRNTPYMAIVNAFNQLARQLLTLSEDDILAWKTRLCDALQDNGGIITETIPHMVHIMGQQAAVDKLPPEETKNRFNVVFEKFVGSLAAPDLPIVLFLDDLQWADIASYELIQKLLTSPNRHALYIIGAYRDNEVWSGHPLASLIEEMRRSDVNIAEAALGPLSKNDVNQLISDTLSLEERETEQFTKLVFEKTYGNPFFVNQLLESFYTEKLLLFDTKRSKWRWKIHEIREYGFSDNVVDLLVAKIGKLSPHCQNTLRQAACIGTDFAGYLLATLQKEGGKNIESSLDEAVVSGLIQKKAGSTVSTEIIDPKREITLNFNYKFVHDKILQAVYTTISDEERLKNHYRLGQSLLAKLSLDKDDQLLFQTVAHLNLARNLIETEEEIGQLRYLNLQAGKKAKLSAANDSALEYLELGMALLGSNSWLDDYKLTLSLYEEAAEAAHLAMDREKVARFTETIFENTENILDKVKAVEVKIRSLFSEDRNSEVLQLGIEMLENFGLKIPRHPNKISLVNAFIRAKLSLLGKTDAEILHFPPMTDEKILAVMRILSSMSLSAYMTEQELYAYFVLTQVRLISEYGHSIFSSITYCSYGLMLCAKFGDVNNGYRMGKLASNLMNSYFDRSKFCRLQFLEHTFIRPWKTHLSESGEGLQNAYRYGMDSGDFQYASSAAGFHINYCFFAGAELGGLLAESQANILAMTNMKQIYWSDFAIAHKRVIVNLLESVSDPCRLDGEEGIEEVLIERARRDNNESGEYVIFSLKTVLACYFGEFERGLEFAKRVQKVFSSVLGLPGNTMILLCEAIVYIRSTKNPHSSEGKKSYRAMKKIEEKIKRRAKHAPMNCLHLLKLLQAEQSRVHGKDSLTSDLYDQAIDLAKQNRFVNVEALASELAADFHLSKDNRIVAKSYAEHARFAYLRWGARAKAEHLEKKYSGLLQKTDVNVPRMSSDWMTTAKVKSLDLHSVFRAAQGISQEIVLEKLLETLVLTVIENAGAEKGFLIMEDAQQLRIEAGCRYEDENMFSLGSKALDESDDLSAAVVRLVYRSKETMVIGHAANHESLSSDPYVRKNRPKSILCMPVLSGGSLSAILYLENNKAADVFTNDRIDALKVLSSQAAISIRNAKLYHELHESKELLQEALIKAQESDRIKSEFIARTSHELLTPLNPIVNIPEWIVEGFSSKPGARCLVCDARFTLEDGEHITDTKNCPECGEINSLESKPVNIYDRCVADIKDDLDSVIESGGKLVNIVEDILTFSNLQTEKASLQKQEVGIERLFLDVQNELQKIADTRSIQIDTSNSSRSSTIQADRTKLKQVLSILGKNAVQFSPDQGNVCIASEDRENGILFSVRDEGIGIDKAHMKIIFESFRQVDGGSTRQYGGTGLGLALAKIIVELHGGRIWVESEPGRGSTFFVKLPQEQIQ